VTRKISFCVSSLSYFFHHYNNKGFAFDCDSFWDCSRRVIFTGTVVVIPDISALAAPGERAECRRDSSQQKSSTAGHEGVQGLKALGVRDLSYRLAFIANSVQVCQLFSICQAIT